MGSKLDFFKKYLDALWSNPPSSVVETENTYLADDFHALDKDGNAVADKESYIGMTHLLNVAFKDFKAVYSGMREEGDGIVVGYHFEGVHTGDLDLSAMGMGVVPASGKKIIWPEDTAVFKFRGDKIVSIEPYGDSAGMENFFEALGVKMPSA